MMPYPERGYRHSLFCRGWISIPLSQSLPRQSIWRSEASIHHVADYPQVATFLGTTAYALGLHRFLEAWTPSTFSNQP